MERFSWLKIYWSVFNLNNNILSELSIQWNKLIISLFSSVIWHIVIVNKCPPHYYSIMRCHSISEHICTIGMGTLIILRTRLTFRIGFDQESSEIGNITVNLS